MGHQERQNVYFLKVISKGHIPSLKDLENVCGGFDRFGVLGSKIYYKTPRWVFLSFDPYSVERGDQKAKHKTDSESLDATIQYLSKIGYQIKVINFERIINEF